MSDGCQMSDVRWIPLRGEVQFSSPWTWAGYRAPSKPTECGERDVWFPRLVQWGRFSWDFCSGKNHSSCKSNNPKTPRLERAPVAAPICFNWGYSPSYFYQSDKFLSKIIWKRFLYFQMFHSQATEVILRYGSGYPGSETNHLYCVLSEFLTHLIHKHNKMIILQHYLLLWLVSYH